MSSRDRDETEVDDELSGDGAADSSRAAPPILEARGLHVEFNRQSVLRDISLRIPRGQTVAVIGESGCGKTVLLKTLIALVRPTRGQILFEGNDLSQFSDKEVTDLRLRYGFVFQNAALFDSMTIGQNVAFPLRQRGGMNRKQIRTSVLERLNQVGLTDSVLSKKPAELSGGMRKRVGLARALILQPDVLLYDEPTTGLDPIMSDVINELILATRREMPVTSVVVTHDMHSAKKVADRVVMLYPLARLSADEPQVVYDGPPDELDDCDDARVRQFVRGEAGERLREMGAA